MVEARTESGKSATGTFYTDDTKKTAAHGGDGPNAGLFITQSGSGTVVPDLNGPTAVPGAPAPEQTGLP